MKPIKNKWYWINYPNHGKDSYVGPAKCKTTVPRSFMHSFYSPYVEGTMWFADEDIVKEIPKLPSYKQLEQKLKKYV